MSSARVQSAVTEARLWLTKSTVRPLRAISHLPEARAGTPGRRREHLVDDQDLGLEVRGDGEREADVHPARVPLDRRVDEPLDLGELDDLVELRVDLAPPHAEDRAVQVDVLAAGQLGVEAGADLEQRADAAAHHGSPLGRVGDRERIFSSVVLPAPFRPTIPTTSPSSTSKETSRSAQSSRSRGSIALAVRRGGGAGDRVRDVSVSRP